MSSAKHPTSTRSIKRRLQSSLQNKTSLNKISSSQDKVDILIVDDNVFNLQTLKTMIKVKFGIESITLHNGHHALKLIEQEIEKASHSSPSNEELEPPFKIIFMDCNMPEMDGFETTRRILELCQH
jgi:CheY-like chemotaxis protein